MIISPLNYPGNKARILNSLITLFAKDIKLFVDVFCGSGIVGLNANAQSLILNDNETRIINLLRYFQQNSLDFILDENNHWLLNEIEDVVGARMLYQCQPDVHLLEQYFTFVSDKLLH